MPAEFYKYIAIAARDCKQHEELVQIIEAEMMGPLTGLARGDTPPQDSVGPTTARENAGQQNKRWQVLTQLAMKPTKVTAKAAATAKAKGIASIAAIPATTPQSAPIPKAVVAIQALKCKGEGCVKKRGGCYNCGRPGRMARDRRSKCEGKGKKGGQGKGYGGSTGANGLHNDDA